MMTTAATFRNDVLPLAVYQNQFFWQGLIMVLVLLLNQWGRPAIAQKKSGDLTAFVEKLQATFHNGTLAELETLFPLEEQRYIYKTILERKWHRKAGFAKVLHVNKDSAVVLVTGKVEQGDWGLSFIRKNRRKEKSICVSTYRLKKGWILALDNFSTNGHLSVPSGIRNS